MAAFQEHESSPFLSVLYSVSKSVVHECATSIQETLDRLQRRYHNSLEASGSGNKAKDIYKKLEWSLKEKDQLDGLREKLHKNAERLSLLVILAIKCVFASTNSSDLI